MAHFVNDKGSRISKSILQWPLESKPLTIGVWGAAGLKVGPNDPSAATIQSLGTDKNNHTWFSLKGMRVCNVMIEARPSGGGAPWDYFQLAVVKAAPVIQEVARGPAALQRAMQLLPQAVSVVATDQWGSKVTITPMTVWAGNRVFITDAGGRVAFMMGQTLYTQPTGDFIRDQYLAAMGTGGAKAAWLETVGKVQMLFFVTFMGGFLGVIGAVATGTVVLARLGGTYAKYKNEINALVSDIRPILEGFAFIAVHCPAMFRIIAKHSPKLLKPSISANDAAYFLGTLLGGVGKAPEVTVSVLLAALKKAVTMTLLLRGPMLAAGNSLKDVDQLKERMRREGVSISDDDARAALSSPCVRDPNMRLKAEDLMRRLNQAAPTIERLSRALNIEAGI